MASSNFSSGRRLKFSWAFLIRRASSRVVMEMSTSGRPAASSSSRLISNFLAVQGMTDTETILLGSMPSFWAYQVLIKAPVMFWGDLQVERLSTRSG